MTWKQRTVIRILLLVARMRAYTPLSDEIKHLSQHIEQQREGLMV